jgi:hypothetical protein
MNEPTSYQQALNKNVNIAVPKNTTVRTDPFKFGGVNDFAIIYKVSCTGLPSVRIAMLQSIDGVNWFTPRTVSDIETALTSKTLQGGPLMPVCVPFICFDITELTNTVTDTVLNLSIIVQKKFWGE